MKKPIGYISYTHGLDGKVKIVPLVSKKEFETYVLENQIRIDNEKQNLILIKIFAFNGKIFICKIDGVQTIDSAKKIIKHEIFVELDDDSDYIDPEFLINFDVFLKDDKKKYGRVIDFGDYGSGNLIEIETKNGKHEFYLCNKNTILFIDKNNKSIFIKKD